MRDDTLAALPVTLTVTATTPRRGLARLLPRRLATATATIDLPVPFNVTPAGMSEDGTHAILDVTVDEDALIEDLHDRMSRLAPAFTGGGQ